MFYLEHHAHEMCKRGSLHFFHHARSMNLDSSLTQAQIAGDHFVRFAVHDEIEHFALARRESLEAFADFRSLAERGAIRTVLLERLVDAIDEILVAERFLDE